MPLSRNLLYIFLRRRRKQKISFSGTKFVSFQHCLHLLAEPLDFLGVVLRRCLSVNICAQSCWCCCCCCRCCTGHITCKAKPPLNVDNFCYFCRYRQSFLSQRRPDMHFQLFNQVPPDYAIRFNSLSPA
jgi:hypothetical protein